MHNSKRSARVLIVDDDPGMRFTLQRILEDEGHRVLVAGDGFEALAQLAVSPIDIALVDYRMIGMNGGDCCAAIHQRLPQAVLYLMTAHVSHEAAQAALNGGAAGILYKPLDLDHVLNLVAAQAKDPTARDDMGFEGGGVCQSV